MYSGISDTHSWVLPRALQEAAETNGDRVFLSVLGGESVTYRQLNDDAHRVSGFLQAAGVERGDRVAIMMPNDIDLLRCFMGVTRLGAIAVMINTELTHGFLAHPLRDCQPKALVVHASFLAQVQASVVSLDQLGRVFVVGEGAGFDWQSTPPTQAPMPSAHDPACIMYTSGTTGAPKGVIMPHAHCFLFGLGVIEHTGLTEADHYYIVLPLFHANGLLMQVGAVLIAGASGSIRSRFSATSWLNDVRDTGATITNTLGAVSAFVLSQPPKDADRDHRLRIMLAAPNVPEHERQWRERFGVGDVLGGYGMTEVNIPLYGERGKSMPGACGRAYAPHFEVEIRDAETDRPLARGEIGEIMVRPKTASAFMAGYYNLPDKTAEAWRNLWFHTGDAGRMDEDGYVTFVDRIKDCIRRRGENISALHLETTLAQCPEITEVAAYAVPSELAGGEDEIMLAIVTGAPDHVHKAIVEFAQTQLPRFMWPRFLVVRDVLEKTGTGKIKKVDLRALGVTDDAVDLSSLYC
jgi:carnitine-CoA ligase